MGFEDMVRMGMEKASEYRDDYEKSYDKSSSRFSNMSNSQLKREAERAVRNNGYDARSMGQKMALKNEIDSRRNN